MRPEPTDGPGKCLVLRCRSSATLPWHWLETSGRFAADALLIAVGAGVNNVPHLGVKPGDDFRMLQKKIVGLGPVRAEVVKLTGGFSRTWFDCRRLRESAGPEL